MARTEFVDQVDPETAKPESTEKEVVSTKQTVVNTNTSVITNPRQSLELMGFATIGTFGLLYLMFFQSIPKDNADMFKTIALLTLGFFFGAQYTKATNK
jgi:hypothetical protein